MLRCTEENWRHSWVCSELMLHETLKRIEQAGLHVAEIEKCEDGGYHIWTDDIVEWFANGGRHNKK